MPLNIGGATVEGGTSAFTIKNTSAATVFSRQTGTYNSNTFAKHIDAGRPMFVAGSSTSPAWQSVTNGWLKTSSYFNQTSVNNGNHYSTTNTRFTAPITGYYHFFFTSYSYSSNYNHPMFWVNGSANGKYRMRGHGKVANYQMDGQMEEVIYCTSGDYVEPYMYGGGTAYYYPAHSLFGGYYMG